MAGFTTSIRVGAPAARTFEVFSDLSRAPERIESIERLELLTEGPVGAGTRFRETRRMFGREATEEMEVTSFEPERSYAIECDSCGSRFRTEFRFREADGETEVEVEVRATAQSLAAKLTSPLSWLGMGAMKRALRSDMEQLKAVAEGAAAETASVELGGA